MIQGQWTMVGRPASAGFSRLKPDVRPLGWATGRIMTGRQAEWLDLQEYCTYNKVGTKRYVVKRRQYLTCG